MPKIRKSLRLWLRKKVIPWAGPPVAAAAIRLLSATIRYKVRDEAGLFGQDMRSPYIFALWHNRILLMPALYEKFWHQRKMVVMISRSRDGELISDTVARFGIESARGSTSGTGAGALIQMTRILVKEGKDVGVTPDGPRGPKYSVQEGVLHLAKTSGYPVVPVTYHLKKKWVMRSWDGFQIPKPFTTCEVVIGKGIETDHPDMASAIQAALGE
jgi:hypothetical protein